MLPQLLLSYVTSERLGILEFKVPNLMAHTHIDTLTVPTFPSPGGLRKTTEHINFRDPLTDLVQPHHTTHSQGSLRKTPLSECFSDPVKLTINSTQHKQPLTMQQHLLPAPKTHIPHSATTKPKSALIPQSAKVTTTPLQQQGSRTYCFEESVSQLL